MTDHPHIDNAPGLVWRRLVNGWRCHWQARGDLVKRGYTLKTRLLWSGTEPSDADRLHISDQCRLLQDEMLVWGRGGTPLMLPYDGTLRGLIQSYQTDLDSTYHKLRFHTRRMYDSLLNRIARDHGAELVENINQRMLLRWHEAWSANGEHITTGHSLITTLRIIVAFGAGLLEDADCQRLAGLLRTMRFQQGQARKTVLTAEHVIAIRQRAHAEGRPSIALAQAIQFELALRQKDVVGEWVPLKEPGTSDVVDGRQKWIRGLRWEEVDGMVLRHVTSKRGKLLTADLRLCPMIMEEFAIWQEKNLPACGPIVVREETGKPWVADRFRLFWRRIANAAGVPKGVWNMDSRAGGISEGQEAGAELEDLRHAATHSDIATTARYSRAGERATAKVLRLRGKHRERRD